MFIVRVCGEARQAWRFALSSRLEEGTPGGEDRTAVGASEGRAEHDCKVEVFVVEKAL